MSLLSFSKSFSNGEVDRGFSFLCYVSRVTISEEETRNEASRIMTHYATKRRFIFLRLASRESVIIRISPIPITA